VAIAATEASGAFDQPGIPEASDQPEIPEAFVSLEASEEYETTEAVEAAEASAVVAGRPGALEQPAVSLSWTYPLL